MQFVIRDDDVNYFSTPADIERWYSDIFARNIPVGFACIPLVTERSDVYPNLPLAPQGPSGTAQSEEFPIGNNAALVEYIKNNPHIEVLQHGTTHEERDGTFEYARTTGLVAEAARGRAELAHTFGAAPRVFVPPHDWIGSHGVAAIEAAQMDIIRGRGAGLRNWLWRWQYAAIFVRMVLFKLLHWGEVPAYPHALNFGKHQEACSYRLEDKDVFEGLEYAHQKNGVFVVVAHVHTLDADKKARLLQLIEQAGSLGAQFVAPSAIFG